MRKLTLRSLISMLAMVVVLGTFNGGLLRSEIASAAAPFPGSGTAASPYLVGTADLFNSIRSYPTSKYYFKLTSDIDLSGYAGGTGWVPIGNTSIPFYGHVDGAGYKITGLKINNPTSNYMGLFGYLGNGYAIANLTLENAEITGNQYVGGLAGYIVTGTISNINVSGHITGDVDVGGLVGSNYGGTINDSHASATVTGTSEVGGLLGDLEMNGSAINNSYASGDVIGASGGEKVGGLVGVAGTGTITIRNSYASGRVTGGSSIGGLAGSLVSVNIMNSYATGDVSGSSWVGGLIGTSWTTALISDSYASGAVHGTSSIGGLLGHKNYNLTIKNSYASGLVNEGVGSGNVGGLVGDADSGGAPIFNSFYDVNTTGQSTSAGGSGIPTGQMQNRSTFEADASSIWDFATVWAIDSIHNGGYPYLLTSQAYLEYDGNGGINGTAPSSHSYIPGETVHVDAGAFILNQALIDAGYVFYGWNTKEDGSGMTYKPGDSFTITSNTKLYANWIIPSTNAGLTSSIGNVSASGGAEESLTNIPYGTTLTALKAAITPSLGATYEIYNADGTTVATQLTTGTQIIVTAQDRITKVTYTVSLNANSAKDITAFSLTAQTGAATINATTHTVAIQVAYGTDRSSLAATFALSADASVKVGVIDQISGATVNDFTNSVLYTVKAGDGSTEDWTVTVTAALNSAKDITAFSLAAQTGPATINATAHTVSIKVLYGTSLNGLIASFTLSAGASAKVGTTVQVSGTTANNFSSAVTFTVMAENGTTQTWKVTVTTAAASSAKEIAAYRLPEQTQAATINATAHTVAIEVAYGTPVNGLVASFTLSAGASASVGSIAQVSGTTANDFTNTVTYTVKAENGSTQDWMVTLVVAKSTAATLVSTIGTVSTDGTANETLTNIPSGTTLAALKAAITPAAGATFEVYEADGITVATALATGDKIIVTAQDGTTKVTYTLTVNAPLSSAATLTSTVGIVSVGGTASETLTNIPSGTTLAALKAAITPIAGATFEVYEADGITVATALATGDKIIVTAQDGTTKVTYTVTVNAPLSSAATLTSTVGIVSVGGTASETLTNIPSGTTLAALKAAITPAAGATFEVYEADGITVSSVLASGDKIIVTAQDGTTKVTYTVTVNAPLSSAATLTSTLGTVSVGGTANETLTNIPNGTTLAALKAAITPAAGATFEVYEVDGITVATALATGDKIIVTAQDGTTKVTYTVTVNAPMSSAATLTSTIGTVSVGGTANETLTNIPSGTTLAALKAAITPAAGATFEVYEADGITVASVLASGDKIIVTAQDGTTKVTYTLTVNAPLSSAATLTSTIGTVSVGGTANETLTNIPNGTTLAALKAAITPAAGATFEVYEADGITVASVLASGDKIIVTAQDGTTKVTYTVTVNAPMSSAATLTSTIGTVSVGGTANETLTNIPSGTTLAALKAAITPAAGATYEVYEVDGITVATTLATGYKIIVTAQDGTTKVTYAVTVNTLPSGGGSTTGPTSPSNTTSSTDGRLTLQAGQEGVVSLNNEVIVSIPAQATDKEMIIIIDKLTDTEKLLTNHEVLVTAVYELLKNFPENFRKPVTITFTFDPASLKSNQTVAVFYYDEGKKGWVEVPGGTINHNQITVTVDHFTKFAVFAVNLSSPADPEPAGNLSDIAGHWAEAAIRQAWLGGIVTGYPDGTFKPNHTVTRAEFTVMLMNMLKLQGAESTLTFKDTKKIGAWATKAVAQAVQAGYIQGYQDGTFRPDAAITRAEMAVMVAKALGLSGQELTSTGFADNGDIPAWAKGAVAAMKKLGLITGKGGNTFAPAADTTRAEAITVLLNMLAYQNT